MIQHLVSRVLLRRWSNHKGGQICGLDLDSLSQRCDSVDQFGAAEDLIKEDPEITEQLWNTIERKLKHPFDLLDQGRILEPQNRKHIQALKECLALHFARSPLLVKIMKESQPHFVDQATQGVLKRYTPGQAVKSITGFYVPESMAYTVFRQRVDEEFSTELHKTLLARTFKNNVETALSKIEPLGIEICTAMRSEFIVGDCPVVTWEKESDKAGIQNGVSWGKADAIFMPLGPRHVIALSKTSSYRELSEPEVVKLNKLQVQQATKEIYSRPGSGLLDVIAEALSKPSPS